MIKKNLTCKKKKIKDTKKVITFLQPSNSFLFFFFLTLQLSFYSFLLLLFFFFSLLYAELALFFFSLNCQPFLHFSSPLLQHKVTCKYFEQSWHPGKTASGELLHQLGDGTFHWGGVSCLQLKMAHLAPWQARQKRKEMERRLVGLQQDGIVCHATLMIKANITRFLLTRIVVVKELRC